MIIRGIRVRVHALMPLVTLLGILLGDPIQVIAMILSVGLHETAHTVAAFRQRAPMEEIEIMPFGAAIRMSCLPYLPTSQRLRIALAGPLASLLLAGVSMALGSFVPAGRVLARRLFSVNRTLFVVNMLPALPLDGGRVFCALLARRVSETQAARIGIGLGRALSLLLVVAAIVGFYERRSLNLTPVFFAVYIIASGEAERRHSESAQFTALLDRVMRPELSAPMPIAWLAVSAQMNQAVRLRAMKPGRMYMFVELTPEGHIARLYSENELVAPPSSPPHM